MSGPITQLIDKRDNVEVIRDQLGAILLFESLAQQALAVAAGKDPTLWQLRVFSERDNPWNEWIDVPENESVDAVPLVNIALDTESFDKSKSNAFERQHNTATFNVDCYGYGVSEATDDGHLSGDEKAAMEAQRARRLVRNILMAAHYTYLDLGRGANQFVRARWLRSTTMFKPPLDSQAIQNITACRMVWEVEFNEFAPQIEPIDIASIAIAVHRKETGELFFETTLPVSN